MIPKWLGITKCNFTGWMLVVFFYVNFHKSTWYSMNNSKTINYKKISLSNHEVMIKSRSDEVIFLFHSIFTYGSLAYGSEIIGHEVSTATARRAPLPSNSSRSRGSLLNHFLLIARCQVGQFLVTLMSQSGPLWPLVAIVSCGRWPQHFWCHKEAIYDPWLP